MRFEMQSGGVLGTVNHKILKIFIHQRMVETIMS